MILCFDCETSGKADFRAGPEANHQPHLVQLGAILLDEHYNTRSELNLIVKPDGWIIPADASSIHGITTEIAEAFGFDLAQVLALFSAFALRSHVFTAHNFDFDALIISSAFHRLGEDPHQWLEGNQNQFCTMNAMTPICQLPGLYGFKWPKLSEAYFHCFNEELQGVHDAMADVRACARIYRWLMERVAPAPTP